MQRNHQLTLDNLDKICTGFSRNRNNWLMMWTYFASVLLQRDRPPLRVLHLERVKIFWFSRLHQLRLQEE